MTNRAAPNEAFSLGSSPPARAVEAWLASAHPSPAAVCREWDSEAGLALVPLGRLFDAVRIPAAVVQRAFRSCHGAVMHVRLADHLRGGPVILDAERRRYYALVAPGTAAWWRAPAAACLGEGTYLGVPHPALTESDNPVLASYWAVPMTRPGQLCDAADVLALVMVGSCLAADDNDAES